MATETFASDHASTDEGFENEGKHDTAEDPQGQPTPSSKTEGDEKKAEHIGVEAAKSQDSPTLEASAEDNLEQDKVEDAQEQCPVAPFSKTEGDEKKADPAVVVVEKIDGSLSSEAPVVDNLKEKETISAPQTISVIEPAPDAAKSQPEEPPSTETHIPEAYAETNEKPYDAIEKPEPVVTEVNKKPEETEKESEEKPQEAEQTNTVAEEEEQVKTVIHQTESESAEKPGDIVEVHAPQVSDTEVVKVSSNSNLEAVPVKAEKAELVSTEVEEKPREQLEAADKAEDTSITGNDAQVSFNEKAQGETSNLVESSPAVAEKVVEGDGKKESSCADEIEGVSKEVVGILNDPKQAFINQESKTDLKEGGKYSAPISFEEKVVRNDDMKQLGTPDAAEGSSRETEVEINKVEEQNAATTAPTEAGNVKAESEKDDSPSVDKEKQGHLEAKVDEGVTPVSEQVRETLASKLEEKEEESIKTGVDNLEKAQIEDPVKTDVQTLDSISSKDLPKETPAKPTQKQSNNILTKVKQSLVRAKKAIIGKSPTSKTTSSEAKGDIKVKQ